MTSVLDLARPHTREEWLACQAVAVGRVWFVLMGRDPAINRLARHLATFDHRRPKTTDRPARRLILTPAEARALSRPR